ncbi:MAG: GNAT family N-acetyltransferase [Candidatus Binatia bacterium]
MAPDADATLRVRRARPGDAAALTRIAHAAKRHWRYPEAWIELWAADLTLSAGFIDAHPVYAACRGAGIVGLYALSRDGADVELEHLWVDPPHMGSGIGALLFEHATVTARSLGGATLRIASDPHAEGFYRRMGARRVGAVASAPGDRMLPVLIFDLAVPCASGRTS